MKKNLLILIVSLNIFNTKSQNIAYSWDTVPASVDNIYMAPKLISWLLNNTQNGTVETMKALTDVMPKGHRAIRLWQTDYSLIPKHPEDVLRDSLGNLVYYQNIISVPYDRSLWWENGVDSMSQVLDRFFKKYDSLGGKLDVFIIDFEEKLSNWNLNNNANDFYGGDKPAYYSAIKNDPRFSAIDSFFGISLDSLMGACDFVNDIGNWQNSDTCYLKWNAIMMVKTAYYINKAIYEPIRKYFPDVKISNYGHYYYSKEFPSLNSQGHRNYLYGNGAHVGSHQSKQLYGQLKAITYKPNLEPNIGAVYEGTAFNSFRFAVNSFRSMQLSSLVPVSTWLGFRGYFGDWSDTTVYFFNTDYWQEMIFHVDLAMNKEDFHIFWNPAPSTGMTPNDNILLGKCFHQLDELQGDPLEQKALVDSFASWTANYVLTGMETDSGFIYRMTPRLDTNNTYQTVLVDTFPATFKIDSTIITIPNGRIYFPETVLSMNGYWVKVPKITSNIPERQKEGLRRVLVYPNPLHDKAIVSVAESFYTKQYDILLYDYMGRLVKEISNINNSQYTFYTGEIESGLYFLKVHTDDQVVFVKKIIVKN